LAATTPPPGGQPAGPNLDQSRQALAEILQLQRDYASEAAKAAKSVFNSNLQAQETAKAFRDIAASTRQFEQNIGDVLAGTKTLASLEKDIANTQKAKQRFMTEARQALNQMNISQAEVTQALRTQEGLHALMLTHSHRLNEEELTLFTLYAEQQVLLQEQAGEMQLLAERAKNIDNAFGLAGGSAEALSGIMKKIGGGKFTQMLGIDEAVSNSRQFASEITNGGTKAATLGDKFKVAGNFAKELGGNLMKSLGPLALIAIAVEQIIDAFKMVDKASGDTAKALGVSYDAAQQMTSQMNDVAMASNDIMVNTQNLVGAQNDLNAQFGTTLVFSGKMAEDYASVKERLNLSAEAMASFTQLSMNNGKGLKENLSTVDDTLLKLNNQSGVLIGNKVIQEGIGKAGAAFRLSMKGSTEEMTKAVFNAKKLGLEIADMGKASNSLLDFESSIGSELEAELLTGKELNLEKARAAALTNDTATLAAELSKNIGTSAEFGKMNVLAQDALAKSMGFTRDEVAKMLEAEETQAKLKSMNFDNMNEAQTKYNQLVAAGASQSQLDATFKDQAFQAQMKSVSQSERMEAITTRLKEVFVSLVEPLMPVMELLGDLFEGIVKPLMAAIGPLIKDISTGLMAILKPVMQILGPMLETFIKGFTPIFTPIREVFASMSDLMTDIFGKGEGLGDVFKVIGSVLGGLLTYVFVPMKAVINFMVQGIKSAIDIVGGFVDIFQGNFGEGMKKIVTGLIGFILRPFQFLIDLATGTLNAVIEGLNHIPGVDLPKVEFNLADTVTGMIPMAKGGITTGPTNALVGEAGREAVIPLDQFYAKLDELIAAVKEGHNIYIGPNKLNEALGLNLHSLE